MEVAYNSDEYKARLEQVKTEFAVVELKRAIEYAYVRCLTTREVIDLICSADTDEQGIDYIKRLQELTLADEHFEHMISAMKALAARSEHAPAKSKARIDRILLRLVRFATF